MDESIRMRVLAELPFLLRAIESDAVEKAVELMGGFGVKRREVRYLMALRFGPLTQKELCDLLLLDKANTTRAVAVLRRDGLVCSDVDAGGRAVKIVLTPKGADIVSSMSRLIEWNIDMMFVGLSDDSIRGLLDSMEVMCGNLGVAGGKSSNMEIIKNLVSSRFHSDNGTGP